MESWVTKLKVEDVIKVLVRCNANAKKKNAKDNPVETFLAVFLDIPVLVRWSLKNYENAKRTRATSIYPALYRNKTNNMIL